MEFLEFISKNNYILIAVIYGLVEAIKQFIPKERYKFMPITAIIIGIGLSFWASGIDSLAFYQGVLVGFAAVGTNQLVKQIKK